MNAIYVVYEEGVFRPLEPVDLPENTPVTFDLRVAEGKQVAGMSTIYELHSLRILAEPGQKEEPR